MFWRKRNDGFEWHKYVRTTIKLKREDRRRRIDGAKHAAVEGLKDAGRASVELGSSGLAHAWRAGAAGTRAGLSGLRVALVRSWAAAGEAARVAAAGLAAALRVAWRLTHAFLLRLIAASGWAAEMALALASAAASSAATLLRPRCGALMRPRVQPVLLAAAGLAVLLAALVAGRPGYAAATGVLVVLALAALLLAGLPVLLGVQSPPPALAALLQWVAAVSERMPAGLRKAVAAVAALAIVLPLGWLLVRNGPGAASLPRLGVLGGRLLEGRALALTGDTLRVRDTVVRLAGVEAPLMSQRCTKPGNRRWRCGEAAQEALARMLRAGAVRCELSGSDEAGHALATCYLGDRDIASALVREGALFSAGGLLAGYGSEEKQAKAARAGLWQGEAERPGDYRAKLWEAAKRSAPDECPIKGQISSGGKYYLVPWSPSYPRAQVRAHRGERWFCSEREALAAGWKPHERS